ncbi:MAG: squalene/phytoene synthase family protein [Ignavibacteria bacterium]|nr:squalene/phytoene synthase family protein [Ignavibacteria bacterium]
MGSSLFSPIEKYCLLESEIFENYNLDKAYNFCGTIAKKHYENFPIASFFLPKVERRFLYSVYSFARLADDIADETNLIFSNQSKLELLNNLRENLLGIEVANNINNPIFLALKDTIEKKNIPKEPFLKLIHAFELDVMFVQPERFTDLEEYCKYSANPIGELVLHIFGEFDDRKLQFSNLICTGLQLANFWQDLSIDIPRGRIYIPLEFIENFRFTNDDLINYREKEKIEVCIQELLKLTKKYFINGWQLILFLSNRLLRFQINATIAGGLAILRKAHNLGHKLRIRRPRLNIFDFFYIFLNSIS